MISQSSASSARIVEVYARLAKNYDMLMGLNDFLWGFTAGRRWAAESARGRVLELGIGTGRNLAHYPASIRLTGVDLRPEMLVHARRRAAGLGREVEFVEGDMTRLPFPSESFDTVVSTLTLCTVPDPVEAIREALRVLVPGGMLHCVEHGLASNILIALVERFADPLMVRLEADHLRREPDRILRRAGAVVHSVHRSRGGVTWRVLGRKPAA